jgi:hypothetical protein
MLVVSRGKVADTAKWTGIVRWLASTFGLTEVDVDHPDTTAEEIRIFSQVTEHP